MKKFVPQNDYVLVCKPTMTAGGIHVPDSAQGKSFVRVEAVGPGRISEHGVLIEPRIKAGQSVMILEGSRVGLIPNTNPQLALVKETDIACVVEGEDLIVEPEKPRLITGVA